MVRTSHLSPRKIACCAGLAASLFASTLEADEVPKIKILNAEPVGEPIAVAKGWSLQAWRENGSDATTCVIGTGTAKQSLNLGFAEYRRLIIWDGGELTGRLEDDFANITVVLTFDGKLPLEVPDAAWEYGVLSVEASDLIEMGIVLADQLEISLSGYEGSLRFDLTNAHEAFRAGAMCMWK